MKPLSQKQKVMKYMKTFGSITDLQARSLHINRLAARINELRNEGYEILSEMQSYKNQDGRIVRYSKYSLIS